MESTPDVKVEEKKEPCKHQWVKVASSMAESNALSAVKRIGTNE